VEIVEVPIPAAVQPLPDAESAPRKDGAGERMQRARPRPTVRPGVVEDAVAGGESIAGSQSDAGATTDTPRLYTLLPRSDVLGGVPIEAPPDGRRGETIVNDGSGPSKEQIAEMNAMEAEVRVDGWMKDELATLRVANGLVDPYFTQMRKELEKRAADAPKEAWPNAAVARDLLNHYGAKAARYGATGSPFPPGREPRPDAYESAALSRGDEPGSLVREIRNRGIPAQSLRDFANAEFADGMVAVVEIRQVSDGRLVEARIVTSSGNPSFDKHVLVTAPGSIAALPPAPETAAARDSEEIRSLWAFQGLITYKKKLRDFDPKNVSDAAYLAGTGLLGLLTGNFDETTGDIDVVDLRNPTFKVKVRLLRVY
jgi:hypothetical protein